MRGHTDTVTRLVVWRDKLISASDDKTIKVWSTGTGRECQHTLEGQTGAVMSMVVCGDKLVSGGGYNDKSTRVWKMGTGWGECERVLEGHHSGGVTSLACVGGGDQLVSVSGDKTMRVWGEDATA